MASQRSPEPHDLWVLRSHRRALPIYGVQGRPSGVERGSAVAGAARALSGSMRTQVGKLSNNRFKITQSVIG